MTMWIPSGSTDRKISFVAVDSTDLKTRETGLSSFTVYRRRNGGSATAYTTPTVTEASSSNMPGVYDLLIDEDTTIDSGHDTEETVLHITQASMAPVTLSYILYRPKLTEGQTVTAANSCVDADIERLQGSAIATPTVAGVLEVDVTHFNGSAGTFSSGRPEVNASHISGSSTAADNAEIVFATDFATNYNTTSDKWQVQADVTAISSDTGAADNLEAAYDGAGYAGGTIKQQVDAVAISGDTTAADNLESEYDGTGYGHILQRTTIASLSSQTSFTLTAGSADNDAYNDCIIVIQDASTAAQKAVGVIDDYTGASKTITLRTDPGVFTMATTDIVTIIADRALKPTVMNRTLDVSAGGEAGVDWANVGSQSTSVNLSGTTTNLVNTVTTYTGNTPQTGDAYARLGAPAGASVSADIAAIKSDSAAILVDTGTTLDGKIDVIDGIVDSILVDTAEIGAAGAGLSAVPWNAAWDAQVESEVTDALNAYDPPTRAEATSDVNSVLAKLNGLIIAQGTIGATGNDTTHVHLSGLAYADDEINDYILVIFDVSTSLYYQTRITDWANTGDLATVSTLPFTPQASTDTYWLLSAKATSGGSGATAQEVWEYATRTLTALDEDSTTIDINAAILAAVGLASANLDTQLADIETKVDDLETRLGTPSDLGSGATVAANLVDIEAQTDNLPGIETKIDTIDGIVDSILVDTAEIGAAGAGLTAINLPDQTMNIVGNITGNLSGSVGSVTGLTAADVGAIKAKTDNLPSDPADASVIAARFDTLDTSVADLPTNAELTTALGTADDAILARLGTPAGASVSADIAAVKSDSAAIKAKTDSLTFTVAGNADVNIQYVNDTAVTGDGQTGTEWGPA